MQRSTQTPKKLRIKKVDSIKNTSSVTANPDNATRRPKEKQSVQVFPNPVSHELNLKLTCREEIIIEIFDLNGNKVIWQHEAPANDFKIDVTELKREVYILQARTQSMIHRQQILVGY